ncbi:lymphotoxin-alpha-like [Genypterus blacodes]|uniref:lymphotoxin-alpha-like n=1 Tax=Genypterus blacodes TaxID=154954 RepID=UPI003F77185E
MEMLNVNRRLTGNMETESDCSVCFCGEDPTLLRINGILQLLQQREARLQRRVRLLMAGVLLLISVNLPLLLLCVLGGSHKQIIQDERSPFGVSSKQQQSTHSAHPSALLTALANYSTGMNNLEWESKDGNAHCDGGFNYSKGNLIVPIKGNYNVYLQITYESYENWSCFEHVLLEFWVNRRPREYASNIPLLSAVETVDCSWKPFKKSLYTSAVFSLEASDMLSVQSRNPELIAVKESKVFFGAVLVPEQPRLTGRQQGSPSYPIS